MTDAARSAEQSDPTRNPQFWRGWSHHQVTGPLTPVDPAHGLTWHADAMAARQEAARRATPAWQRAERSWERLTGADREPGLHRRGKRS